LSKPTVSMSGGSPNSMDSCRLRLRRELEGIPRLLVIRLRSLGDSILALPLVESLKAWRPELRLDVLVEASYAGVFYRNPAGYETLLLAPKHGSGLQGRSRIRTCIEVRKRRYSAVLNLHGGPTSLLFTLASGARIRIGQGKYRQGWAYTARIPPPPAVWMRSDLHTVEDQLTVMRWLDLPLPERPRGNLYPDENAQRRIRDRLTAAGISTAEYLLIHPTATQATKQWPEGNFARLADRLHQDHRLPVVFSAAPHERAVLAEIGRHTKFRHHYWDDLGLEELFALIRDCRIFIGNDSGPTHAAAAWSKPLVVIWGSSDYRVWHPWETRFEAVRSDLPCVPCPGYKCEAFGRPKCIDEIPVDRVFAACNRLLNGE
jgi:ADP-heptose:LPS heptosyltransferase